MRLHDAAKFSPHRRQIERLVPRKFARAEWWIGEHQIDRGIGYFRHELQAVATLNRHDGWRGWCKFRLRSPVEGIVFSTVAPSLPSEIEHVSFSAIDQSVRATPGDLPPSLAGGQEIALEFGRWYRGYPLRPRRQIATDSEVIKPDNVDRVPTGFGFYRTIMVFRLDIFARSRTTSREPISQQVSEATFGPQSQFRSTILSPQTELGSLCRVSDCLSHAVDCDDLCRIGAGREHSQGSIDLRLHPCYRNLTGCNRPQCGHRMSPEGAPSTGSILHQRRIGSETHLNAAFQLLRNHVAPWLAS